MRTVLVAAAIALGAVCTSDVGAAPTLAPQWTFASFGTAPGRSGLHVADLDGDGTVEILAAGGTATYTNSYWYVLGREGSGYVQRWVSDISPDSFESLRVAQLDTDPALEILVGVGPEILVYDGATRRVERVYAAEATPGSAVIWGLTVANVDADPAPELLWVDTSALYIVDASSGALEYRGTAYGGHDVAVGNVDADPGVEIVVGRGTETGWVLDGATRAVEWANPAGFGSVVRLGDLDGDGKHEVVAGYWSTGPGIRVYDADLQTMAGSIPAPFGIGALRLVDVDGDGPLEIVFGGEQNGILYVHDGQDRSFKWQYDTGSQGVTDIVLADPDADSARELVVGVGYESGPLPGQDWLFVLDVATHVPEWRSADYTGWFLLAHGDVDADGQPEIVSATRHSDDDRAAGILFVHDARTRRLEFQGTPPEVGSFHVTRALASANVDADPQQEIFVAADGAQMPLAVYDGLTHALEWSVTRPLRDVSMYSLQVADVDLDGAPEVVVGIWELFPGAAVRVYDARTGALEWQTPTLGDLRPLHLEVGNVDADPQPEAVMANHGGEVFVIDAVTRQALDLGPQSLTALQLVDLDGNGVKEILASSEAGDVNVIGLSGQVVQTLARLGTAANAFRMVDLDGDGSREYVWAAGGPQELRLHDASGALSWRSGHISPGVGFPNGLEVADVDGNGIPNVVVSLGDAGYRVYEGLPLPQPSLSVGDTTATEVDPPGFGTAVFTVSASPAVPHRTVVDFATVPGTAGDPFDYGHREGTVILEPGMTSRSVAVTILSNNHGERPETFDLRLSNPGAAILADASGTCTILDDDTPAAVIGDQTAAEGQEGTSHLSFAVTLSNTADYPVTLAYGAASGIATAGIDFGAVAGTLVVPPFATVGELAVPVFGDRVLEVDETFVVNLAPVSGATIGDGQGLGTLTNDDVAGLSVAGAVVRERVGAPATVTFPVTLSPTGPGPVTVNYATADGTATAGSDYEAAAGTLTFEAGVATQVVNVAVRPDAVVEGVEVFTLGLSGAVGAPVAHGAAAGRILDPPAGGDFDGDGATDLVWRHEASGQNAIWFMNGPDLVAGTFTTPESLPDTRWRIVGSNDFNADGRPDLLWRHATSGENVLWYMNGSALASGTFLTPATLADTRWRMAGTGDFDLDGRPDILWRHAESGEAVLWYMNGSALASGTFLTPPGLADVAWEMAGTGDFDLDGRPDVVWRHAVTGQAVVWFMNDGNLVRGASVSPTLEDVRWRLVATGDYNSDGKVDIVWRHASSGENVMWFMDGIDLLGGVFTDPSALPDVDWRVVGPR